MTRNDRERTSPGRTILGGAAGGLSYEGAWADALAREEREWRHGAGRQRPLPAPRHEPTRSMPPVSARMVQ